MAEIVSGQPLFPGDSDVVWQGVPARVRALAACVVFTVGAPVGQDQMFHIMRCFGKPTPRMLEFMVSHPLFVNVQLPDCTEVIPLEQRFPMLAPDVRARRCLCVCVCVSASVRLCRRRVPSARVVVTLSRCVCARAPSFRRWSC
jgi:hypothetical protein